MPGLQNCLAPPLRDLTPKELFLLTQIPIHLLEGFAEGKFKPNYPHRRILSKVSLRFYKATPEEKKAYVNRRKYRVIKDFLSTTEKELLFENPNHYSAKLDQFMCKYWDRVILKLAS